MTSWKERISILHLEDNPDDVELLDIALKKSKLKYELQSISSKEVFLEANLDEFDIIISDYNLKNYDGLSAIKYVRSMYPVLPVILLSGTVGEELAADLLRAGANDFVLKSNLKKMPIAMERAMYSSTISREKHRFQKELLEKNLILDTIFDSFEDMIFLKDINGKYLKVNKAFCEFLNLHESEIIGGSELDFFPNKPAKKALENDEFVKLSGKSMSYELEYIHENGKRIVLEVKKSPLVNENSVTGIVGQCSNVTSRKMMLEETIKAKSILSQAEKLTRSGSFEYDADLDVLICSSNFKHMLKLQIEGDTISFRKFAQLIKDEDRQIFDEGITKAVDNYEEYHHEHRFYINKKNDSTVGNFKVVLRPDFKDEKGVRFYGTLVDVTAEHESQIKLMERQEQDRQELARELHDNLGQKMNAISMFVSKISEKYPDSDMNKVKDLAHESIDDLGYLINNISAKQIEEHSLNYAIEKLIEYMPDQINVNSNYDLKEDDISPFVKSQVYRVIQESLNNVAKYSEATEVQMNIKRDGGLLSLNIEDDGKGFVVEDVLNGNGLQNITHRVRRVNGLINIDSKVGSGTRVMVKMPIN